MSNIRLGFAPTRRSIFSAPDAIKYRGLTTDRLATVEQYRVFELTLPGTRAEGTFCQGTQCKTVQGFLSGEDRVSVRFMPESVGEWEYRIASDREETAGTFLCTRAAPENHGPVRVSDMGVSYADGNRFLSFGTTSYGWIHQPDALRAQTLHSLANSPFNKIRMLVFPKFMPYNNSEPRLFPFRRGEGGKWDIARPDFDFWDDLDRQILALDGLGIEADLILFHPYDRWGFAALSREENLAYLSYCVNRLGAYKNIWWSLANEYDMVPGKTEEDWDAFGARIAQLDSARHLLSVHNCCQPYPDRDWITHCSIQSSLCRQTLTWGWEYQKPVFIDECGYEGDIEFTWGNLSAFEMVHRFWMTVACGGWCTHGETFYREDEILWWGKGGQLRGKSVPRIAFLRNLLESLPGVPMVTTAASPLDPNGGDDMGMVGAAIRRMPENSQRAFIAEMLPMVFGNEQYRIYYLGRTCPAWLDVECPSEGTFTAEVIDVWDMIRTPAGMVSSTGRIALPAREGQAVLVQKTEVKHE